MFNYLLHDYFNSVFNLCIIQTTRMKDISFCFLHCITCHLMLTYQVKVMPRNMNPILNSHNKQIQTPFCDGKQLTQGCNHALVITFMIRKTYLGSLESWVQYNTSEFHFYHKGVQNTSSSVFQLASRMGALECTT